MKKFQLLRPLPNAEVGTVFEMRVDHNDVNYITNGDGVHFGMDVAYNKMWFRELTEHDDKERHLELLAAAFWENIRFNNAAYYGYVGLEDRRPFGNSNVEYDICHIIGLISNVDEYGLADYTTEQLYYAEKLYRDDLVPYLKSKYALS